MNKSTGLFGDLNYRTNLRIGIGVGKMQFSQIPETGTPRTMILFGDVITIRHTKPSDMLRRGLNVWLVLGPDTRIIFTLLFITIFLSIFLVVVE